MRSRRTTFRLWPREFARGLLHRLAMLVLAASAVLPPIQPAAAADGEETHSVPNIVLVLTDDKCDGPGAKAAKDAEIPGK